MRGLWLDFDSAVRAFVRQWKRMRSLRRDIDSWSPYDEQPF